MEYHNFPNEKLAQEFITVASDNVYRIYNSTAESLHKSEFIVPLINEYTNIDTILSFLVENDIIETETDEDLFFLTPETYDIIELGDLEMNFWYLVDYEIPDGNEEYIAGVDSDQIISELKKEKKYGYFFLFFILFTTILIPYSFNKKTEPPSNPLSKKNMQNLIKKIDSLEAIRKSTP